MEASREGPSLAGKERVGGKEGFAGNDEAFQEEGPKGEKHVECAEFHPPGCTWSEVLAVLDRESGVAGGVRPPREGPWRARLRSSNLTPVENSP